MAFQIPKEILEKFKGKSLEELFGKCEIVENEFGEFLKITDPFNFDKFGINPIQKIELDLFERILRSELQLIPGIGAKKSTQLKKRKIHDISELLGLYTKNFCDINDVLNTISSKNVYQLRNLRKTHDEDFLFCVTGSDLLFIDIETTGQTTAEVFLIGIGYYSIENDQFQTELLFAREIAEEAAVLYYFLQLLPKYKMLVTYNGRTFDIPFIRNRVSVLFEPDDIEDIVDQIIIPAENKISKTNSDILELSKILFDSFIHFDLYNAIRRDYKNLLPNFRLTTVEEHLLAFERVENLPSAEVPLAYKCYVTDPETYIGGIYKTIEHNFYDVVNLERLLRSWMRKQIEEFCSVIFPFGSNSYEEILEKLQKSKQKLRSFNLDPFLK
ncbi:MAG: hypothetical protein EU530_01110 [Promethearchaeota archaeon]|nr:MAG: hypothetical protein EU530_01110 [Candidatus Lokiarchaeota archaeon]